MHTISVSARAQVVCVCVSARLCLCGFDPPVGLTCLDGDDLLYIVHVHE
jgi:hypothetical protein